MSSCLKTPHTVGAFRQMIADGIVTYRNSHSAESAQSNIKCEKIWPAYEKAGNPLYAETSLAQVEAFHDALSQMEKGGLLTAVWSPQTASFTKIHVTQEQASKLAEISGRLLKTEFYGKLKEIAVADFGKSNCPQLKKWVFADGHPSINAVCQYGTGTADDLKEAAEHLRTVCRCVENAYLNTDDILERNFSIKMGLGSKGFGKLKSIVSSILSESQFYDNDDVLKKYHILQNSPLVGIRGTAAIVFDNGEKLSLTDRGAIYFERPLFEQIEKIETSKLYSVENLTTFNSLPFYADGLVVYTEGFPNFLVTDLIEKTVTDNNLPQVFHCGDMDAYGYKIIQSIDEKVSAEVQSFRMGLSEYEKYKDMAIPMNIGNRTELEKMLNDTCFSAAEKALFQKLLDDGKVLEQECLSAQRSLE